MARPCAEADFRFNIHTLIGGQMGADSQHRLFLIYPEGWGGDRTRTRPYQIIGNSGFGKPISWSAPSPIPTRCFMLLSWASWPSDATRLCAADVDFPIDLLLYTRGTFEMVEHRAISARTCRIFPTGGSSACGPQSRNLPSRMDLRTCTESWAAAYSDLTSSETTKNCLSGMRPKEVVNATSAASLPVAISTRPIRGWLCLASRVHQRPPR